MRRRSPSRERKMIRFGQHIRTWRVLNGLTAQMVADRAGITRVTLRAVESGDPGVRLESVFSVLEVLGLDAGVLAAVDPEQSERGRALMLQGVPKRVAPS